MKHTILITGGLGYIGSVIAVYFLQQKYNLVIVDHQAKTAHGNHVIAQLNKCAQQHNTAIKYLAGDMVALESFQTYEQYQFDAVIHCAAYAQVHESVIDPKKYYDNNVAKTVMLLNNLLESQKQMRIIFSSSCAVYGVPQQSPLTEDHPFNPISPYGKTKAMVEELFVDYARAYNNFNYVSLRYFNAAGALPEYNLFEQHEPETHLIPLALDAALQQKPFTVFGAQHATLDGTCIRDFIHVWDVAHAHWKAFEYLMQGNRSIACNIGTGNGNSVEQILAGIENITQKPIQRIFAPARSGDPAILVATNQLAQQVLCWKPLLSDVTNIIESTYKQYYLAK